MSASFLTPSSSETAEGWMRMLSARPSMKRLWSKQHSELNTAVGPFSSRPWAGDVASAMGCASKRPSGVAKVSLPCAMWSEAP